MSDDEATTLRTERGRLLVVDDDPDVCALLEARLAGRGFEVACTTSAPAALDSLATAEVDVVLTDVNMARHERDRALRADRRPAARTSRSSS